MQTIFDRIGLEYFLDSGYLLGQQRFDHYLSYDGDIDICVLREDFEENMDHI